MFLHHSSGISEKKKPAKQQEGDIGVERLFISKETNSRDHLSPGTEQTPIVSPQILAAPPQSRFQHASEWQTFRDSLCLRYRAHRK